MIFIRVIFLFFCMVAPFVAHSATCDVGYYLRNGECSECNNHLQPYYCPGDDLRHECPPNDDAEYIETRYGGTLFSYGDRYTSAESNTPSGVLDCFARYNIELNGGVYLMEAKYDGAHYSMGTRYLYFRALDGYYLSSYWFTSWGVWYRGVKACTNAPENAVYTGPGTPDSTDGTIVDANDCPWKCVDGFGRTVANTCAPLCRAGITKLNSSTGVIAPLFETANTVPAIHIKNANGTCHADLIQGTSTNAIHIRYNGITYHTTNDNK